MQWGGGDDAWEEGGWNNKWRPSGSGTTSHARRQRIQAAARERDRLAALGDSVALADKAKKEAQKAASMKKQAEEAAQQAAKTAAEAKAAAEAAAASHDWVEVGPSRKKPRKGTPREPPCQKEKTNRKGPPCQKEKPKQKETPCQKEKPKQKETPCQKEQDKKNNTPCQKEQQKTKETPCQQEQDKKEAPCQKEQEKKGAPCQKEQEKKDAPGQKDGQKEEKEKASAPEGAKDGGSKALGPSEKEKRREQEKEAKDESLSKGKKTNKQADHGGMEVDWGNGSSSASSSSSSASSGTPSPGTPDPLTKGDGKEPAEKPPKRVAVDWHKVLVHNDLYDLRSTKWLQKLKDAGYEVHLLSYCGWKRSKEVYDWAWFEWDGWASVSFTWKQCGKEGKAQWCLDHGVSKLVDDNIDICTEAIKFGIEAYPIVPAGQRRKKGQPKLQSCFSDFPAAAIDILKDEKPLTKG